MNLKFTRINYFQVNNEQCSKWRAGRRGGGAIAWGPQDKSVLYLHKNRLPSNFWEGSEVTIVIKLSNLADKSLLANPRIYKLQPKLKMKGR